MAFPVAAAALLAAGTAASAAGSAASANAQNRAGRRARDADTIRGMRQRLQLSEELYGTPDWEGTFSQVDGGYRERLLRDYGLFDHYINEGTDQEHRVDLESMHLNDLLGLMQSRGLGGARPGIGQEGGIIGDVRARARRASEGGRQIVADFDRDTQQLEMLDGLYGDQVDALGAGEELMAEQFGRGADQVLENESRRAIRAANSRASTSMMQRGLGNSTLLGNQQAANEILGGERLAAGKVGVRQATTDRRMSARRARTAARMATGAQTRDLAHRRRLQRTGLQNLTLERDLNWDQMGTNLRLQTAQGPLMNPMSGIDTSGYYAGMSGAGDALQGAGNAAAGLGSMALMAELYPGLFQGGGG